MKRHTWWIAHVTMLVLLTLHIARFVLRGWDDSSVPPGWMYLDFRKFFALAGAVIAALDGIISTLMAQRARKRTIFHLVAIHLCSPVLAVFFSGIFLSYDSVERALSRLLPDPPGWSGPP
jgi:hypothetical protein